MDINYMRFINYSFKGICGDVYIRLDYKLMPQIKLYVIYKHGAITYNTR